MRLRNIEPIGQSFAEICEVLSEWIGAEEIPLSAASYLAAWADSRIIVSFD